MLVYGDPHELADPRDHARTINRQLDRAESRGPGLERHAALVGALVETGKLLQGIADSAFARTGQDDRTDSADALNLFLLKLGEAVCRSWDSGRRDRRPLPRLSPSETWPAEVQLRIPEGFAFYAVYPEAYIEAARRLKLVAAPRVIGIRSIGTSLAAAVAAAVGAPPPITVRPFGEPFARRIAIAPELQRELLDGDAHFLVADEGPGQSGSSFAAVVAWLQERSVPLERITLLPSHSGEPGPAASEHLRRLWRTVRREPADFNDRWPDLLARWCATVLGELDGPPRDISGGGWRSLRYMRKEDWPAVVPAWERRKFLICAGGESFLAKFAGLGGIGEEKLAVARRLHSEGLIPEPVGLVHGFLLEHWDEHAASLVEEDNPASEIGRYIGKRARLLPAMSGSGATVEQLLAMARRNISLEFGAAAARSLDRWQQRAAGLEQRVVRVRTDNKLDRKEWLRTKAGRLIKTDALDHHQAHDLIGCQDVAWDVAGAIVEFDLDQKASDQLANSTAESSAGALDPELLEFYRTAYPAFRLGGARLGEGMISDANEQLRIRRRGDRYAAEVRHVLESGCGATRHESSVG